MRLQPFALAPGVKHVFLADAVVNVVTIFDRSGKTRALTGFEEPQGITTDSAGTLYVANTIDNDVEEFAPPYPDKPHTVLAIAGQWPVDVAVARDGTVAVINICRPSGSRCQAPGSVYFYKNNKAQSPCAIVSGGNKISRTLWAAFDGTGTLYVAGVNDYTTTGIGRITGECAAASLTLLRSGIPIHFAAGVEVDRHGDIAIVDSGGPTQGTTVDVFAAPTGESKKLALLSKNALNDSSVVSSFVLTKSGAEFYTAEPHGSNEYAYPAGGYAEGELSPPSGGNLIEGVAVTPAEVP